MSENINDRLNSTVKEADRLIRKSLGLPETFESDIKVFMSGICIEIAYIHGKKVDVAYNGIPISPS